MATRCQDCCRPGWPLPGTRSELIRRAIQAYVAADEDAAVDAAIVEGYRRIPPPERDPWAEAAARRSIAAEPW